MIIDTSATLSATITFLQTVWSETTTRAEPRNPALPASERGRLRGGDVARLLAGLRSVRSLRGRGQPWTKA